MERTVLLTGGSGFIGGHLRGALQDRPVLLLGRKRIGPLPNERHVYMDLQEPVHPKTLMGVEYYATWPIRWEQDVEISH